MKIEEGYKLDFCDILFKPKRSDLESRSQVDLCREITFKHSKIKYYGIPIIAANMDTVGTFEMHYALAKHKIMTCLHKHYKIEDYPDDLDKNYYMLSSGIGDNDWEKLQGLMTKLQPNYVCIDVPNGYSSKFHRFCKRVRETYPEIVLMAGNVVSDSIVEDLINNLGIDVVKVGIGSGAQCLTRTQTGCGIPQVSAVIECADAAHGIQGHIISDGGIVDPGSVAKAFGSGADFVMIGSMFSGHDQCGGKMIEEDGKQYMECYGMSSHTAMNKHYGGVASYRSSEGRSSKVPYKGSIDNTVLDILGGLRSCATYIGSRCIKDIPKCTTFIKVNRQLNTTYADDKFRIK
jgi:GMP reductase